MLTLNVHSSDKYKITPEGFSSRERPYLYK